MRFIVKNADKRQIDFFIVIFRLIVGNMLIAKLTKKEGKLNENGVGQLLKKMRIVKKLMKTERKRLQKNRHIGRL